MDFWDLTKLLFRRWYLSAPLLTVALGATVVVGVTARPDYNATGYVQLVPPMVTSDTAAQAGRARNPWADLGPDALGQAVMITVRRESVINRLVADGLTENFTVTMDGRSPIITIQAIGGSRAQASGTVRRIAQLIADNVAGQQRAYGVTGNESITTLTLDAGDNVQIVRTKIKRALIVILGAGLLLTAAATIGLDAVLRRRTRRRGTDPAVSTGSVRAASAPAGPVAANAEHPVAIGLPAPRRSSTRVFRSAAASGVPKLPEPAINGNAVAPVSAGGAEAGLKPVDHSEPYGRASVPADGTIILPRSPYSADTESDPG